MFEISYFGKFVILLILFVAIVTINKLYANGTINFAKFHKMLKHGVYQEFPLVAKTVLTPTTAIYRFGFPDENDVLGLPIGQHISIKLNIDEKMIVRSYTPISLDSDAHGFFELLVKSYPTGTISKNLGDLKIGDMISVTGPQGNYDYKPNCRNKIGMIAGGTGITPMYQIMKAIYSNSRDTTQVSLIFGSCCEEELFLKNEIDNMVAMRPNQFKVYYLLDTTDRDDWEGGVGYITKDLMEKQLADPRESGVQLLLCGPPRMVSAARKNAIAMGYVKGSRLSKMEDQIFVF